MKEQKNNKVGSIIAGIVALVIFISIVIPSGDNSSSTEFAPRQKSLEVVEIHECSGAYTKALCGTVKNNSSRNYGYVQVEVNLYGKDGSLIGSTLDNVNNLGAGESWKFKAIALEDNVARFEVKDVTGF